MSSSPRTDISDEELMDNYCAGDSSAFAEIYQRYNGRLIGFLVKMVGYTQAHDVAQVTFMKVHKNRHKYRSNHKFASWIFTIARNTALDHLRSAPRRREKTGIEIDVGKEGPTIDPAQDKRVRAAIEALPEDQKHVVLLHWFAELTFEEIGKIVGASGSAVRVRAHRAYKKLRVNLEHVRDGTP